MYINLIQFTLLVLSPVALAVSRTSCEEDYFHCFESGDRVNDCDNRRIWIKPYKICNGKLDCPNGEDEAIFVCKRDPNCEDRDYFACATGGKIMRDFSCNNIANECFDNSDEMYCKYNRLDTKKWQGNCRNSEIECLPGECKSLELTCNGNHDCSNGLDESLEICFGNCTENEFQCGNGRCISKNLLCNSNYDCPDGADELPVVCTNNCELQNPNEYRAPKSCKEPKSPKFAYNVTFDYKRDKEGKYVLPNTPVKFECRPYEDLLGSDWNVCKPNGEWAHPLAKCRDPLINGCFLQPIKEGRPHLYRCLNDTLASCDITTELTPPINNLRVLLICKEGFYIDPPFYATHTAECKDKKWKDKEPKCLKNSSIFFYDESGTQ
ncbi:modular serine protease-like [Drosophila willistoni]|uniref:modular serine protease-like n=1 Tax=Drosophila willistoni TaxID=7260 RepID=UPI000C26D5B0|nr:modular serine protease-like [Drosophila willistoni]